MQWKFSNSVEEGNKLREIDVQADTNVINESEAMTIESFTEVIITFHALSNVLN